MPYTEIMVHLVWSTKKREPILTTNLGKELLDHIRTNASEKGIYLDFINCQADHIHCLLSLGNDQNLTKIVQLIKGESSHWINQMKIFRGKFSWQDEYFAVSVSESNVKKVREYIRNQGIHHKKKSFQDEYEEFMRLYGFEKLG